MQGGNDNQSPADEHELSHAQSPVGDAGQLSDERGGRVQVAPDVVPDEVVTWEASEYIHHQKTSGWFMSLALGTLVLSVLIWFLTKDWFSVVVLLVMAVAVGIFAGRPPQTRRYSLSRSGLDIGGKHYSLDQFRSYGVTQEGAILSVTFLPTQRFMVPVTIYFSQDDEPKISQILASSLPHEERPPDIIDRWTSKLRF